MKTFEQVLQEEYQNQAIADGDLCKEDYLELDPDNLKVVRKAIRVFLELFWANRKVNSYEQGFPESKLYQDIKTAFDSRKESEKP